MRQRREAGIWLAFLVIPMLVVCLLWIPFGFSLHGLIEEWGVLGLFAGNHLFFVADAHSPLAAHALRPLTVLPQAIGYFLDPDSFVFWHLQLMLTLVLKGAATGCLVWLATGRRGLAVLASAMVLVYPADTMQLAFRSLHINMALSFALLGACVCVAAYGASRRSIVVIGAIAGALLFASACAMYEAALPLFPLPWLVLFGRHGLASVRLVFRRWGLTLAWCGGLAVYLLYVWHASTQIHSYQSSLAAGHEVLLASLPNLFRVGAMHGLLGGWVEASAIVFREYASYLYLLIGAMILLASLWLAMAAVGGQPEPHVDRSPALAATNTAPRTGTGPLIRLVLIGFTLTLLGYAPYLMSPAHQVISQRTFLFATPGATMAWIGVIGLSCLVRLRPLVGGFVGLMLSVGLGMQIYQFHHYVRISMEQDRIVRALIDAIGPLPAGKTLVVLDGTNSVGQTWMYLNSSLTSALTYFYGRSPAGLEVCRMPAGEWQVPDGLGRKGTCSFDGGSIRLHFPDPVTAPGYQPPATTPDHVLARDATLVISIDANGKARRLSATADGVPALQARYRGVLASDVPPWGERMFRENTLRDRSDHPFGKYWSLEIPLRGVGWREPEWQVGMLRQFALAWKTSPVATLYLDMAPSEQPYVMRGSLGPVARPDIPEKLALRVNGTALKVMWSDPTHFEAKVPKGALLQGRNAIDFDAPVAADYYGFSFVLESFTVQPSL